MFLWAKQLIFPVHQVVSNLRAGSGSHSSLCPDSLTYGTESICETAAFRLPLISFYPIESQIQLLKKYSFYLIICLSNFF